MFEITSTCHSGGYTYCRTNPLHPNRNSKGLYPLHRVVIENSIGRLLNRNEIVHHIDSDKMNNDISNLKLMSNEEHSKLHGIARGVEIDLVCPICGNSFSIKRSFYRVRIKHSKNGTLFFSRKCSVIHYHRIVK